MNRIKLLIEKNKKISKLVRYIFQKTILKYIKYKRNKVFLQNAPEVMLKINQVFKELDIQYWLTYGTLLGIYRDNNFIKHDLDIDLGLFLEDNCAKIESIFSKHGFKKLREITIDNRMYGLEESYEYKGIVVDLFYFTKNNEKLCTHWFKSDENKSWSKTIQDNGGLLVVESCFPYSGFRKIKFLNQNYFIPSDTDSYLKACYGEQYMTPDLSWDASTMTKNMNILNDRIGVVKNYD